MKSKPNSQKDIGMYIAIIAVIAIAAVLLFSLLCWCITVDEEHRQKTTTATVTYTFDTDTATVYIMELDGVKDGYASEICVMAEKELYKAGDVIDIIYFTNRTHTALYDTENRDAWRYDVMGNSVFAFTSPFE